MLKLILTPVWKLRAAPWLRDFTVTSFTVAGDRWFPGLECVIGPRRPGCQPDRDGSGRLVAVAATLRDGRQLGSGYWATPELVLTAAPCTFNKNPLSKIMPSLRYSAGCALSGSPIPS